MSIFSLSWFKSEHQKEKERLELEQLKLANQLYTKQLVQNPQTEFKIKQEIMSPVNEKPYLNLKLVNNVLTIILTDGNILSKPNATQEDFNKARGAHSEEELFKIASSSDGLEDRRKEEKEAKRVESLIKGLDLLKQSEDFVVDGNTVYLKGISRSLPPLLVEKFAEIIGKGEVNSEEYVALKRFFMWACLNPRAEVADKLYDFLVRNSFRITKQGFFTALRNVVTVEKDNELVKFVSNSYNKVKAVWKKKPADYWVHKTEDGGYSFNKEQYSSFDDLGNLQDLYLDLPNMAENRFTDAHTRTFDIRVGQVVSMPMEDCRWNTDDCGAEGLHFTSNEIHYVGCGDTSVLVLINPMKVVGIGQSKGRCYEYLPIMTVPTNEATELLHDLDFDTLELDEDFAIKELEGLAEKAKDGFAKEAKKYEFNIPTISSKEINNIVASLDDMKQSLSTRVSEIY